MKIGIDLGGTKIEVAALDEQGAILLRERVATPRDDYRGTIEAIAALVELAERRTGLEGSIGIGIPGTISPRTGLVKNANSVWLNGQPLKQDLQRRLARPVRLANDANCLAVSEAVDGAGAGAHVVLALILGTGAGAGIALGGRVHSGGNGIGGEWGHNPLPWLSELEGEPIPCYCGRDYCVETYVSGTGFCREYQRLSGDVLAGAAIIERLKQGDEFAARTLEHYLDRLGRAIAAVVNILDPDVIVLGGGMSNVRQLYSDLPGRIEPWVFGREFDTPIRQALHGDSSGVRGAAWLWP